MCSILGLGFMRGHKAEDSKMIRTIMRHLLIESEGRGTDASGLAFINSKTIHVVKKDIRGSKLISLPEYTQAEHQYMTFSTATPGQGGIIAKEPPIAFIGHCRQQTKGSYLDNNNNHPIVRDKVVGVHNGCISNDDRLFRIYEKTFNRNGLVDSEIIFALIEQFSKAAHKSVAASIQKMSKATAGSFACAMTHGHQPYIVWLFRRSNPCEIVIFRDIGMVIWASSGRYIENATKNYEAVIGNGEIMEFKPNSGMGIDLHRNIIHRFDLESYKYESGSSAV